ncbi:MAG: alpha/beta fold hydrolase [Acidimicrobiales bacterium]|jgi:3-oxoadipate enol-lactonase
METIRISGVPELACDLVGDGPPVVFLHGIGGNRTNWTRQLLALEDEFSTMAWDARGYGDSADVAGERRFSHFADDLARLLDQQNIEKAHLVGLSMGARILLTFFPLHAERVATLTLCDCFYGFDAMSDEKRSDFMALREKPLREGKTFADLAPALVESLVSPDCPPEIAAELYDSIVMLRVEPYLKTLMATTVFDAYAAMEEINVPVQLIFGEHDRLSPPSIGEEMVDLITDARLEVLEGAGHLSNLERPAQFNDTLRSFLAPRATLARYRERL